QSTVDRPLHDRRRRLERMGAALKNAGIKLSPATQNRRQAERWFRAAGRGALDGIVAKRIDDRYQSGERAMLKIKPIRTGDCVVGGFRYASKGKVIGSLLLGLFDKAGLLHHVGFTSSLTAADRIKLTPKLEALVQAPGFTG